jgi:hypothetical protein
MKKEVGYITTVIGKRWYNNEDGKTYHRATIFVYRDILLTEVTEGDYGEYKKTAYQLLKENNYDIPAYNEFVNSEHFVFFPEDVRYIRDLMQTANRVM